MKLVQNCAFSNNVGRGACLVRARYGKNLLMDGCTFVANELRPEVTNGVEKSYASEFDTPRSVLYLKDTDTDGPTVTVRNTLFANNTNYCGYGCAVMTEKWAILTNDNVTVIGNRCSTANGVNGAGAWWHGSCAGVHVSDGGTNVFRNCIVLDNRNIVTDGLRNFRGGTISFANCLEDGSTMKSTDAVTNYPNATMKFKDAEKGDLAIGAAVAANAAAANAGWVVRAYHDNGFVERVGGLWTNASDRVTFDANWLLKTPHHPKGMSFCARTGFTTSAAGRHVLALYVRDAPRGTPGTPWIDCAVTMDGKPLAGLAFDAADEVAEPVAYDRTFDPDEGLRVLAPTWRSFDFDVPADGLYEIAVRYGEFPRYTRVWIDDVQALYNQGRAGVDAGASFRGDLDRTERTDRQRINFFGEDRVVRFLKKGSHRIDLYAHWGPWVWDDEMKLAKGRAVFGLRRLRGLNPESEAGFWFAGGKAARLALPTTAEGEWRYVVKNARGDVIDGPWEYAVIANAPAAAGHVRPPVVVDRVDCTEGAGGKHLFREHGASTLVTTPEGVYRRVGPKGLGEAKYKWIKGSHPQKGLRPPKDGEKPDVTFSTHDWYAYTLAVKNPGRAHVLRCRIPNDEYRLTTVVAYDRKTRSYNGFGMLSGDAPVSGAFSDLDIFLWPNSDAIDVMVINSEGNHGSKLNRAGAVQSMELLEYPDGLPPLEAPAHGWNKSREFGRRDLGFVESRASVGTGGEDATWTFDDLYLPMERAAKAGDWHEVRRRLGDFQTNHRWWFETLGWPATARTSC
jgi:hypothetical protein